MSRLIPLMAVMLAVAPVAVAQSKAIGRYNDWRVYTEGEGRSMVCFAAVEASDKAPKAADHGEVTFYVAAFKVRPGDKPAQPARRLFAALRSGACRNCRARALPDVCGGAGSVLP